MECSKYVDEFCGITRKCHYLLLQRVCREVFSKKLEAQIFVFSRSPSRLAKRSRKVVYLVQEEFYSENYFQLFNKVINFDLIE